ncbi:MAG: hypothetical protein HQ478_13315 [Chloroflexi bacterium]|nr:hypothetical protein [Chloroflexota bacterium]
MSRRRDSGLSRTLGTRLVGVAGFNLKVYRDIDDDEFADYQAQQIVLMAAIAVLVGLVAAGPVFGFLGVLVVGARYWIISSMIARKGAAYFPGRADEFTRKRAMRLVGYSTGPLLLALFFAIPLVGPISWFVLNLWSVTALAVGTRVILGDPPLRDIAVILAVGSIPQLVLLIGAVAVRVWG